jgi:hypothetical protein
MFPDCSFGASEFRTTKRGRIGTDVEIATQLEGGKSARMRLEPLALCLEGKKQKR